MVDMNVHQHSKEQLNQVIDGTVIGSDVHTHSPLTQTILPQIYAFHTCIFICIFIPTPIYGANKNS